MQPKKNSTTEQQCPVYNTWTYASKNNLFCFFSSVRDIKAVLFVQSGNNVSTLQLYLPLRLDFSVKTMSHFAAKCPSEAERRAKKKDYRIKLKQFLAPFIISQIQSQDPLFYKNRSGVSGT